jgi:phosphate starvation-inducible PhoH-like protein
MSKKAARRRDDSVRQSFIVPRNRKQDEYLRAIARNNITVATGPAGTGKTYLAAATAAMAYDRGEVTSIQITRPIVEAMGEDLGYLPGDLNEKCDPYLRPIFDGLREAWGQGALDCMLKNKTVEISPLAYMRGRTFKNAFIIADEFQNASSEQVLMLMTRIGEGSKIVMTGDPMQRDRQVDGLEDARRFLSDCPGIAFVDFGIEEVVRHETVTEVLRRWDTIGVPGIVLST